MNWVKIIQELMDSGFTQEQIAKACGAKWQSHISSLYSGKIKVPNWDLGDALIRLHKKVSKKAKSA